MKWLLLVPLACAFGQTPRATIVSPENLAAFAPPLFESSGT